MSDLSLQHSTDLAGVCEAQKIICLSTEKNVSPFRHAHVGRSEGADEPGVCVGRDIDHFRVHMLRSLIALRTCAANATSEPCWKPAPQEKVVSAPTALLEKKHHYIGLESSNTLISHYSFNARALAKDKSVFVSSFQRCNRALARLSRIVILLPSANAS